MKSSIILFSILLNLNNLSLHLLQFSFFALFISLIYLYIFLIFLIFFVGSFEIFGELKGYHLVSTKYQHPFYERQSEIVIGGDYITTESGKNNIYFLLSIDLFITLFINLFITLFIYLILNVSDRKELFLILMFNISQQSQVKTIHIFLE